MPRPARHAGFTLFELMIAIAIAGVLASIAVPNMRDFIRNNRLSSTANDLMRSFQVARAEAIKRQSNVAVCASANPDAAEPTCSGGRFSGWIVFQDPDDSWAREVGEEVVARQVANSDVSLVNDNESVMSFNATGFKNPKPGTNPVAHILICDERGDGARTDRESFARAVLIEKTGRARVSRLNEDVEDAVASIGGECWP